MKKTMNQMGPMGEGLMGRGRIGKQADRPSGRSLLRRTKRVGRSAIERLCGGPTDYPRETCMRGQTGLLALPCNALNSYFDRPQRRRMLHNEYIVQSYSRPLPEYQSTLKISFCQDKELRQEVCYPCGCLVFLASCVCLSPPSPPAARWVFLPPFSFSSERE